MGIFIPIGGALLLYFYSCLKRMIVEYNRNSKHFLKRLVYVLLALCICGLCLSLPMFHPLFSLEGAGELLIPTTVILLVLCALCFLAGRYAGFALLFIEIIVHSSASYSVIGKLGKAIRTDAGPKAGLEANYMSMFMLFITVLLTSLVLCIDPVIEHFREKETE